MYTRLMSLTRRHRASGVVAAALLFGAARAAAQMPDSTNVGKSGVYRTAADFVAGRLEFPIVCATEQHRIDRHTALDRPYVDVTHAGERTRIAKNDLFGYRECGGLVVRFADGKEYTILGSGPLTLYARAVMVPVGKGFSATPVYYLSRTPDGPIGPLTRDAVMNLFPNDHRLHDQIDIAFRSDRELTAYDARHGQYRLLRWLSGRIAAPADSGARR